MGSMRLPVSQSSASEVTESRELLRNKAVQEGRRRGPDPPPRPRRVTDSPTAGLTAREALRHDACGTPLEARWYCPTCERSIPDGEAADDRLI